MLQFLIHNVESSVQIFEELRNAEPPLFFKKDVLEFNLLHTAASVGGDFNDTFNYILNMVPAAIYQKNDEGCIPLLYACMNASKLQTYDGDALLSAKKRWLNLTVSTLLRKAYEYDPQNWTMAGLFAARYYPNFTTRGEIIKLLAIEDLIETYGAAPTWATIEKVLSPFEEDLPILHQTIKYAPQYCNSIIRAFPDSVVVRDSHNRLPVHIALETGMTWSSDLPSIINANRSQLKEIDPLTKLPLFALAAWGESCDL